MEKYLIAFGAVCLLVIAEWIREIRTFRTTHYHICSSKLNTLKKERKVVLLSDLHNYCYGEHNEKLLQAIKKEKPDMILIAGDMLVGQVNAVTEIAETFLTQLPAICPTYYANGNHEQRMKLWPEVYGDIYEGYKEKLLLAGIKVLENESTELEWDGQPVEIHGLEIPWEAYGKLKRKRIPLKTEDVEKLLGKIDKSKYQILIAHNPAYGDVYLDWGADLTVSGHVHGGVARIPGFRGVISPQFELFPKYSGEMTKKGEQAVVVSKGIGIHTIKIRFLNPAEVVVMHISGSEER